MGEAETHTFRCAVVLVCDDVTEALAAKILAAGTELESTGVDTQGYFVVIDEAGRIDRV